MDTIAIDFTVQIFFIIFVLSPLTCAIAAATYEVIVKRLEKSE